MVSWSTGMKTEIKNGRGNWRVAPLWEDGPPTKMMVQYRKPSITKQWKKIPETHIQNGYPWSSVRFYSWCISGWYLKYSNGCNKCLIGSPWSGLWQIWNGWFQGCLLPWGYCYCFLFSSLSSLRNWAIIRPRINGIANPIFILFWFLWFLFYHWSCKTEKTS